METQNRVHKKNVYENKLQKGHTHCSTSEKHAYTKKKPGGRLLRLFVPENKNPPYIWNHKTEDTKKRVNKLRSGHLPTAVRWKNTRTHKKMPGESISTLVCPRK